MSINPISAAQILSFVLAIILLFGETGMMTLVTLVSYEQIACQPGDHKREGQQCALIIVTLGPFSTCTKQKYRRVDILRFIAIKQNQDMVNGHVEVHVYFLILISVLSCVVVHFNSSNAQHRLVQIGWKDSQLTQMIRYYKTRQIH